MNRFVSVRQVVLALVLTTTCGVTAAAAQDPAPQLAAFPLDTLQLPQLLPPVVDAERPAAPVSAPRRPGGLLPLYVSFASLQALDAHSTTRALDRGAVEANPLMRGLAGHPVGMFAVKAAATAAVVYSAERIWKKNKAAAVIFMVAANSGMAWVVQHNYRAVR